MHISRKCRTAFMILIMGTIFSCGGGGGGKPGSVDLSFGDEGIVIHNSAAGGNSHDFGYAIIEDSQGCILVAGCSSNGTDTDMAVWRFKSNGEIDTSFGGGDGIVTHDKAAGGSALDVALSIALDSDGRIFVTGYSLNSVGNTDMVVWCYTSAGELDTDFSGDGIIVSKDVAGTAGSDGGTSIIVHDGKILVTGYSCKTSTTDRDMVIWRYDSDGNPDTTFSGDGVVTYGGDTDGNDSGNDIIVDSSGNILVAGYTDTSTGGVDMTIWRYTDAGELDTTFGEGDGIVTHDNAAGGYDMDYGESIAVDADGRIFVSGESFSDTDLDMVIWCYTSAGVPDTTFGSGGFLVHDNAAGGNGAEWGNSISLDSQGRVLVTGKSPNSSGDTDMVIWRYTKTGILDTSFHTNGYVVSSNVAGGTGADGGNSLIIDSKGRIMVAGFSNNSTPNADMVIWCY